MASGAESLIGSIHLSVKAGECEFLSVCGGKGVGQNNEIALAMCQLRIFTLAIPKAFLFFLLFLPLKEPEATAMCE